MENLNNFESVKRFNPLNDYLFYKVFGVKGAEKQLLGFLNAVLGRSGKKAIKDVEIVVTAHQVWELFALRMGI